MSRSMEASRLQVANKLARINRAIAAEERRIFQIQARLAALIQLKNSA